MRRNVMKKLLAAIIVAALFVLNLSACSANNDYSIDGSIKKLNTSKDSIGTVNDLNVPAEIYTYFFNYYKASQETMLLQYGYTEADFSSYWNTAQDNLTMYEMLQEQALNVTKEFSELLETVRKKNITLTEEESKTAADEIDNQIASFQSDGTDAKATYEKLTGLKVEQMKAMNVLFSYINAYTNSFSAAANITDEEVEEYYNANSNSYETATAQHVLIEITEGMTDEEIANAKATAEEVLDLLNQGTKTMAELASEYSSDPGSKDTGGEYTFGRGEMVPEFEDWAFNAKEGDTGIVETDYGFHVMKSIAVQRNSLETVSADIKTILTNQKVDSLMADDVASLSLQWTVNEDTYAKLNTSLTK